MKCYECNECMMNDRYMMYECINPYVSKQSNEVIFTVGKQYDFTIQFLLGKYYCGAICDVGESCYFENWKSLSPYFKEIL